MDKILPLNVTAQLAHRVRGNPPAAQLETSVANCYPGLEFDLRGIWAKLFEGIVLHETSNNVLQVETSAPSELQNQQGALLLEIVHPQAQILLSYPGSSPSQAVDRGNAIAELLQYGGTTASCRFLPIRQFSSVSSSSVFLDPDGRTRFPPELGVDADPGSSWVSAIRNEANSVEFLEWDFGDVQQLEQLRVYQGEGIFRTLFPAQYTFLHRLREEEAWRPFKTQDDAEEDGEGWLSFALDPFPTRFVRMEISELRQLGNEQFLVSVSEVQFDPFIQVDLTIRSFFPNSSGAIEPTEGNKNPALDPAAIEAGELTQSLCSPWQHDYRDCVCFYWAASRPDFVNVDPETGNGHNWTDLDREVDASGQPIYKTRPRDGQGETPILIEYEQLFESWEQKDTLKFQLEGKDEV